MQFDAMIHSVLIGDTEGRTMRSPGRRHPGADVRVTAMNLGTIVVIDAERTKAAEKHVKERLANGECIACKATAEDPVRKHKKRGLCDRCHARWLRNRARLSNRQKRASYDALLIREGQLLHEHEISALTANDVFANASAAIEAPH